MILSSWICHTAHGFKFSIWLWLFLT